MSMTAEQTDLRQALDTADSFKYAKQFKGLNEDVVRKISAELKEPEWMLEHRLKSLELFYKMPMPTRGPDLSDLDFNALVYYAAPEQSELQNDREKVDPAIKDKFARLGIPEAEQRYLAGAGGQMDSEVVYHKIKEKRAEK